MTPCRQTASTPEQGIQARVNRTRHRKSTHDPGQVHSSGRSAGLETFSANQSSFRSQRTRESCGPLEPRIERFQRAAGGWHCRGGAKFDGLGSIPPLGRRWRRPIDAEKPVRSRYSKTRPKHAFSIRQSAPWAHWTLRRFVTTMPRWASPSQIAPKRRTPTKLVLTIVAEKLGVAAGKRAIVRTPHGSTWETLRGRRMNQRRPNTAKTPPRLRTWERGGKGEDFPSTSVRVRPPSRCTPPIPLRRIAGAGPPGDRRCGFRGSPVPPPSGVGG